MLCCPNCGGRFFKTLELRFELFKKQINALLYKKRCKRCKEKYLIELTAENGKAKYNFATFIRWQQAHRLREELSGESAPVVGHYTRLISGDTADVFKTLLNRQRY